MRHIDICWNQYSTQIKNVPYVLKSYFVPIVITYVLNPFVAQYNISVKKHVWNLYNTFSDYEQNTMLFNIG